MPCPAIRICPSVLREVCSCIQPSQRIVVEPGDFPRAIGCSHQRWIVVHNRNSIRAHVHVELDGIRARGNRLGE